MERFRSGNFHQYEHQLNDSVSPSQTNGCYNGQTNGIIALSKTIIVRLNTNLKEQTFFYPERLPNLSNLKNKTFFD